MATTRWGILSTADIGRRKVIPGLRKADRVEVLGIASRDEAQARAVATELEIPRAYGSYEALLADPDIDVVYIPLPNHLHLEWTIAAARAVSATGFSHSTCLPARAAAIVHSR